jgi:hypothetical protein
VHSIDYIKFNILVKGEIEKMKPIWYFVGLILLIMGLIIVASGIYQMMNPPESKTILSELNPDLWWGIIMTAAGTIYLIANRGKTVR